MTLKRAAKTGEDGADHLVAKNAQRGDRACGLRRDDVSARALRLFDESLRAEPAEVVGGLSDAVVGLAGHRLDLVGELGDGEAPRCTGERDDRGKHGADAFLIEVDAADV